MPGARYSTALGLWDHLELDAAAERAARLSVLVLVPIVVVGLLVVASVLAVLGYLVTNFGFTVTYTRSDHVWHLRRGLFTTRETSMDANRLRGVNLVEPLGLRLARGARLSAIVTGLNREQQGSSTLVPPAPQEVAWRVAAEVLGTTEPVVARLVGHGPAAVRRRYTRAIAWPLVLTAALVVGVLVADVPPGWIALALAAVLVSAGLGHDRARGLGHAAAPRTPRRPVGQPDAPPSHPRDPRRHRLDLQLDVVPAPRRPDHRPGHDGRRSPVGHGPRRPEATGTALARDAVPGLVEQFLETAGFEARARQDGSLTHLNHRNEARWSRCEAASASLRNSPSGTRNPAVTQPG